MITNIPDMSKEPACQHLGKLEGIMKNIKAINMETVPSVTNLKKKQIRIGHYQQLKM